jgi:GNAT superfamily N-acetyltransferase
MWHLGYLFECVTLQWRLTGMGCCIRVRGATGASARGPSADRAHRMASGVAIRRAGDGDLPALSRVFGQGYFFAERLDRQQAGRGVLLLAFNSGVLVGNLYLWLEAAEEREIRENLPAVPLMQHLEVDPSHRGKRVGTRLITYAERLLRRQGHARVALGVDPANVRATELYERLGYREWDHGVIPTTRWEYLPGGDLTGVAEECRVLVKILTGQ